MLPPKPSVNEAIGSAGSRPSERFPFCCECLSYLPVVGKITAGDGVVRRSESAARCFSNAISPGCVNDRC